MCCADCGDTIFETLTVDHLNGGGNKHRKKMKFSGSAFYQWLVDKKFPPGYQVLCIRCNWLKGRISQERYQEITNEIKNRH